MGKTCRYCGDSVEARTYCSSCQRPLDADPEGLVSQTIGSHRIESFLGEGPCGMVFRATHLPSGRPARLKILDSELAGSPLTIEAAGQLVIGSAGLHESLPELIEVDLERADARIVSVAWREGETLRERLDRGPLAETEACVIVGGVLKALDALHASGMSHRDLKPENVLLAPQGTKPAVHLLDVGPGLVSAKARRGAWYRSPEQAKGGGGEGQASDIYSCGAILYEALTGRKPFDASDFDVLMSQISLRSPTPILEVSPHLDPELAAIVTKAMEPLPGGRYRTALDMLRAMRTFVAAQQRPSMPEASLAMPSPDELPALTVPAGAGHGVPEAPPAEPRSMLEAPDLPAPPRASAPSAPSEPAAFHFESADDVPALVRPEPAPIEPDPSAQRSGGTKVAAILFLIVAVVAGGALLYYTFWAEQERQNLTAQLERQRAQDAGAAKAVKQSKSRGTVRVKLNGVPRGAIWTVDGRRLGANPFRAPRSATVHRIRVEHPDYEPFETEVSFGDDLEIDVEMTAVENDAPAPRGFKAYTHGLRANQRPVKRRLGGAKQPENRFGVNNAPDRLRDRR